jgi:polyhydroxybutyrate depolymerase
MGSQRTTRCTLGLLTGAAILGLSASACGTTPAQIAAPGTAPASTRGAMATATSATSAPGATSATRGTTPTPAAPAQGMPRFVAGRHTISIEVEGTKRTAVAVVPADLTKPAPLVFAFHGHGGSGLNFDKKIDVEGKWPDAIVLYPDGLVGHKGKTDPDGVKPGWQTRPGEDGDRDLRFYDALFAAAHAQLSIDDSRIFVMGHSNGSAFTSLLLNVRGDKIAATANLSAQPGGLLPTDPVRSMFMSMGEQDPIVPYENQVKSIPLAEEHLGVDTANPTIDGFLTIEKGPNDLELDTYVHPDGHEVPDAVPALVVAFFQRQHL